MNAETIWIVVGLVLVIADLVFGTFFILFVGLGALITGVLVWAGILPDPTLQWIIFALISTLGLILFRKKLLKNFGPGKTEKYIEHVGQKVTVEEEITANGTGRVIYRGAGWPAKTVDGRAMAPGTVATIKSFDGIMLEVD